MRNSIRENDMEMQAKAKDAVTGRRTEGGRIRPVGLSHLRMEVTQRRLKGR